MARVAAEEAAHEGERGEVVLVAELLHRLLGVLERRLELQEQDVVDHLLGASPVVHAADASQVLGADMEHVGIGLHRVYRLAVLAEQLHEMLEGAQRCRTHLALLALCAMVGALVAHAQHQAAEHTHALLVLAHRVLIAEQHVEEVVDGVK